MASLKGRVVMAKCEQPHKEAALHDRVLTRSEAARMREEAITQLLKRLNIAMCAEDLRKIGEAWQRITKDEKALREISRQMLEQRHNGKTPG